MNSRTKYLLGFFLLVVFAILLAIYFYPEKKLHLVTCDVGQGDAMLVSYGTTQILVDGGPDNSVINCLSKHMPFWDRQIELVILTHPQKDHFGGLIDVFQRYKVSYFLANEIDAGSQEYGLLKKVVGGSSTVVQKPSDGMVIRLGLIHLDIVHPSGGYVLANTEPIEGSNNKQVLGVRTTNADPNEFSIVAILKYGEFGALLSGDIQLPVIDDVSRKISDKANHDLEYIKIPHHGSKNGITDELLNTIEPEVAVISVGKNSYGHPHKDVIKLLNEKDIRILRTDQMGDIEIISDGKSFWLKNKP